MSDKEILSQEEIDALLQNVDEEDQQGAESSNDDVVAAKGDETEEHSSESHKSSDDSPVSIDFFNQERIVRGQLPVMDRIYDRMAKRYVEEVYQMMSKEIAIEQQAMKIYKYKELIASLRIPTMVRVFRLRPLRGKAMILFDSTFVFNLVDNYFGGSSQFNSHIERMDFTPTEVRIVASFIDSLLDTIVYSWSSVLKITSQSINTETNPQLVNICEANDLMLVNRFQTKFEKPSGEFTVVLPYSMIEPIKQQLELGTGGSDEDADPNWTKSLVDELMDVELPVKSTLGETQVPLSQINEYKEGDFIPLTINETVTLDVENIPLFTAQVGSADEKSALQIINKIKY